MNLLEVKGLSKGFKQFSLKDISFNLPKGYIMGYVGQNGAGKTTTIKLINHLCKADSGEVYVNGIRYVDNPIHYKEQIGFIGDESFFPKEMKLKDIRTIMKDFYVSFDEQKFNQMVRDWNLPENKKIQDFSRGMKVKLMFLTALCRDVKLLILDEATNGLDPVMRAEILELLQDFIEDGEKSILFSTHMLDDLESIADYIVFIKDGRIVLNETKDELLESYMIVKGDAKELTNEMRKVLIGLKEKRFAFEALVSSENATVLKQGFVFEKPAIDQIMIHMIGSRQGGIA